MNKSILHVIEVPMHRQVLHTYVYMQHTLIHATHTDTIIVLYYYYEPLFRAVILSRLVWPSPLSPEAEQLEGEGS